MIYWLLFFEFFKIGLFAVGGGLVTVPFLFDLAEKYKWFSAQELTDMIAVAESTPGPIGVNMATFAGYNTAGFFGGIVATLGLVLPSLIVIIIVSRLLDKFACNQRLDKVLQTIKPFVFALILFAGAELAKISVVNYLQAAVFVGMFLLIYFTKKSPIFYMGLSAVLGILLNI